MSPVKSNIKRVAILEPGVADLKIGCIYSVLNCKDRVFTLKKSFPDLIAASGSKAFFKQENIFCKLKE